MSARSPSTLSKPRATLQPLVPWPRASSLPLSTHLTSPKASASCRSGFPGCPGPTALAPPGATTIMARRSLRRRRLASRCSRGTGHAAAGGSSSPSSRRVTQSIVRAVARSLRRSRHHHHHVACVPGLPACQLPKTPRRRPPKPCRPPSRQRDHWPLQMQQHPQLIRSWAGLSAWPGLAAGMARWARAAAAPIARSRVTCQRLL